MSEKAAIINARCTVAMIRAMALQAENDGAAHWNEPPPNGRAEFENIIVEEAVHWNAIHTVLYS